ncbi:hypothetical protein BKA69DRAFT_1043231, partial [Paraphysoderma sedebokerense]
MRTTKPPRKILKTTTPVSSSTSTSSAQPSAKRTSEDVSWLQDESLIHEIDVSSEEESPLPDKYMLMLERLKEQWKKKHLKEKNALLDEIELLEARLSDAKDETVNMENTLKDIQSKLRSERQLREQVELKYEALEAQIEEMKKDHGARLVAVEQTQSQNNGNQSLSDRLSSLEVAVKTLTENLNKTNDPQPRRQPTYADVASTPNTTSTPNQRSSTNQRSPTNGRVIPPKKKLSWEEIATARYSNLTPEEVQQKKAAYFKFMSEGKPIPR